MRPVARASLAAADSAPGTVASRSPTRMTAPPLLGAALPRVPRPPEQRRGGAARLVKPGTGDQVSEYLGLRAGHRDMIS